MKMSKKVVKSLKPVTYVPDRSKPLLNTRFSRRKTTVRPITFEVNFDSTLSPSGDSVIAGSFVNSTTNTDGHGIIATSTPQPRHTRSKSRTAFLSEDPIVIPNTQETNDDTSKLTQRSTRSSSQVSTIPDSQSPQPAASPALTDHIPAEKSSKTATPKLLERTTRSASEHSKLAKNVRRSKTSSGNNVETSTSALRTSPRKRSAPRRFSPSRSSPQPGSPAKDTEAVNSSLDKSRLQKSNQKKSAQSSLNASLRQVFSQMKSGDSDVIKTSAVNENPMNSSGQGKSVRLTSSGTPAQRSDKSGTPTQESDKSGTPAQRSDKSGTPAQRSSKRKSAHSARSESPLKKSDQRKSAPSAVSESPVQESDDRASIEDAVSTETAVSEERRQNSDHNESSLTNPSSNIESVDEASTIENRTDQVQLSQPAASQDTPLSQRGSKKPRRVNLITTEVFQREADDDGAPESQEIHVYVPATSRNIENVRRSKTGSGIDVETEQTPAATDSPRKTPASARTRQAENRTEAEKESDNLARKVEPSKKPSQPSAANIGRNPTSAKKRKMADKIVDRETEKKRRKEFVTMLKAGNQRADLTSKNKEVPVVEETRNDISVNEDFAVSDAGPSVVAPRKPAAASRARTGGARRKKPAAAGRETEQRVCSVRLWQGCDSRRGAADIADLDLLLNAFEDVAFNNREDQDVAACRKAVNSVARGTVQDVRNTILVAQKYAKLKLALGHSRGKVRRQRTALLDAQQEHARTVVELHQLNEQVKQLEERLGGTDAGGDETSAFLASLRDLHANHTGGPGGGKKSSRVVKGEVKELLEDEQLLLFCQQQFEEINSQALDSLKVK